MSKITERHSRAEDDSNPKDRLGVKKGAARSRADDGADL